MDEPTRRHLNRSMAALAEGDRDAFDPVYQTLWPLLTGLIAAMSQDRMIAEDIAHEAMLKILGKVSTFDPSKDALAWSMTIAVNEYRSYRRKRAHRAGPPPRAAAIEPINEDTPEAITIRENLGAAARVILDQLRPQDREVLVAAIYDGLRPPLTATAFRKRLQRALAQTRLLWKRRYGDGGQR